MFKIQRPTSDLTEFQRWIATVNSTLLALISCAKEEAMLARLADIATSIPDLPQLLGIEFNEKNFTCTGDPLNVSGQMETVFAEAPEKMLSVFIFRTIGKISLVLTNVLKVKYKITLILYV